MKTLKVRVHFDEPVLGTSPNNSDIYREFIGSKSPDAATVEEEVAAIGAEEYAEKGMTVFPRLEDGTPYLYDYQVKGFFKDTCGGLRRVPGTESSKITSYLKVIDKLIFPQPRRIVFHGDYKIGECQRPLRAQTMQGERISLACSEMIYGDDVYIDFDVLILDDRHQKFVVEALDYGCVSGIGQWRNSGMGRFHWEWREDPGEAAEMEAKPKRTPKKAAKKAEKTEKEDE